MKRRELVRRLTAAGCDLARRTLVGEVISAVALAEQMSREFSRSEGSNR
jgi:hypothetical protein